jgi:hypothetical protein
MMRAEHSHAIVGHDPIRPALNHAPLDLPFRVHLDAAQYVLRIGHAAKARRAPRVAEVDEASRLALVRQGLRDQARVLVAVLCHSGAEEALKDRVGPEARGRGREPGRAADGETRVCRDRWEEVEKPLAALVENCIWVWGGVLGWVIGGAWVI